MFYHGQIAIKFGIETPTQIETIKIVIRIYIPLHSRHVVNIFLLIYQLGTCCVYVVFVATNIKSILDLYLTEETDVRLIMLITLLPLILINWVRKLKYLAPFSTVANAVTLVSFGIILYYIFREPISFEGLAAVGEIRNWPLFFGTVLFALEAIGVVSWHFLIPRDTFVITTNTSFRSCRWRMR